MGEHTAAIVAAERKAQGLPPKTTDPLAYRDLAVLLRPMNVATSPRVEAGGQPSDMPGEASAEGDISTAA